MLILFQTYNRGVCIFCPASLLQFEFPCQTLFGSIASNCSRFKPYRPCVSIPNLKLWGSLKEQNNSSPTSFDTIRSDIWQSNLGCSRVFSSSVQWPRQYHQAKSVAKGTNFILQSNGMAPERPKEEELPKLGLMLLASPWPLPTGAFLCPLGLTFVHQSLGNFLSILSCFLAHHVAFSTSNFHFKCFFSLCLFVCLLFGAVWSEAGRNWLCVYVCVFVCVYLCVCLCLFLCVGLCLCLCLFVCFCVCLAVCGVKLGWSGLWVGGVS